MKIKFWICIAIIILSLAIIAMSLNLSTVGYNERPTHALRQMILYVYTWGASLFIIGVLGLLSILKMKKSDLLCINCNRSIPINSKICPYCANTIIEKEKHDKNKKKQMTIVVVSIILAVMVILSSFFFIIYPSIQSSKGTLLLKATYPGDNSLYGNYFIWSEEVGNGYKIFLYNLSSEEKISLNEDPIHVYSATIFKDKVVWLESKNGVRSMYLYDIVTKNTTKLLSDEYGYNIKMYGDNIVWSKGSPEEIYLYNLSNGTKQQIPTTECWQVAPDIYENYIVWKGNKDVFLYDIETQNIKKIATNLSFNRHWDISIYQDKIVFGDNHSVYLYNLSDNTTFPLAEHSRPGMDAYFATTEIYGNYVLIQENTEGIVPYSKCYVLNIKTGKKIQIEAGVIIQDDRIISHIYGIGPSYSTVSIYLVDVDELFDSV